ncbi:UNVERIFIED_CONTAM: X-Pro dipeptidyl-peptidase, partial [Euhalothece sp. KZN 001]
LNSERAQFEEIASFIPAKDAAMDFINLRRVVTSLDGKDVASWFSTWTKEVEEKRTALKDYGMLNKRQAVNLSDAVGALHAGIKEAYEFYYGYDPDFTWWVEEPFRTLDDSLQSYAKFAASHFDADKESVDESGIVGNPIGADEINRRLDFEMIAYSPQELIELANEQYTWTYDEMLKASRELGYGDDWKKALEVVKTTHVEEGEQPSLVKELADETVTFLEDRDLVTIPDLAKETWRMGMLSPEWQKFAPFFLGGEVVRIAYPTNTMTHQEKMMSMRGNNPHFSKAVVHHELIPGHHLQQFMNQRYETQRRMFRTPFWTEGWALYWEFVLWEKDFPNNPEDKIGMVYWRMHRAARIVFSLNYHLGNWTPQQCIEYLVDKVGHEYANAEAEVRRSFEGNYGPLYQ